MPGEADRGGRIRRRLPSQRQCVVLDTDQRGHVEVSGKATAAVGRAQRQLQEGSAAAAGLHYAPQLLAEAGLATMQYVRAMVGWQLVPPAIELERRATDAIGEAAHQLAEERAVLQVTLHIGQ